MPDESGRVDWPPARSLSLRIAGPGGRPEQGWTTAAAYGEALQKQPDLSRAMRAAAVREYAERLELAKLKVIAGALGLPLGELTQRDKARQLRKAKQRARILTALSGCLRPIGRGCGSARLAWPTNPEGKPTPGRWNQRGPYAAEWPEKNARPSPRSAESDFQEGVNRLSNPTHRARRPCLSRPLGPRRA